MSDFFQVTTDYILKGIEPIKDHEKKNKEVISDVLYISSTTFITIGLLCSFGGWYEYQTMDVVFGSMIIQAIGVAAYFIGRSLSQKQASFYVKWLNILDITFIPISMMTGFISVFIFHQGWIAPYPVASLHIITFTFVFLIVLIESQQILKK